MEKIIISYLSICIVIKLLFFIKSFQYNYKIFSQQLQCLDPLVAFQTFKPNEDKKLALFAWKDEIRVVVVEAEAHCYLPTTIHTAIVPHRIYQATS